MDKDLYKEYKETEARLLSLGGKMDNEEKGKYYTKVATELGITYKELAKRLNISYTSARECRYIANAMAKARQEDPSIDKEDLGYATKIRLTKLKGTKELYKKIANRITDRSFMQRFYKAAQTQKPEDVLSVEIYLEEDYKEKKRFIEELKSTIEDKK